MMANSIVFWFAASAVFLGIAAPAFPQGGGDLNPDLRTPAAALGRYQDLRVGLSVHWGPDAQTGNEISWCRGRHGENRHQLVPVEQYDQLYKTFNPVKFDAEEWLRLAKRWGMRYIMPTAKHHDGFALWFSRYSPYTMEKTPLHRDIMKELGDACRRDGVVFGTYYSNLDWYHPDWTPYEPHPGPLFEKHADTPNLQRYLAYMKNQLTELIRDYGVEIIQFDGEWPDTWTHEIGGRMYRDLRAAGPNVIMGSRIDKGRFGTKDPATGGWNWKIYAGDFEERERMVSWVREKTADVRSWANYPWEAWVTIDRKQWAWNPHPDLLKPDEIVVDIVTTVGNNGNYCINVPPRADGSFAPDQIAILDEVGRWLARNGAAIYATRGGPFQPAEWGVSTHRGNKAWLHVMKWTSTTVVVRAPKQEIRGARLLDGPALHFTQSDGNLRITVPENLRKLPDTVIELEFAGEPGAV